MATSYTQAHPLSFRLRDAKTGQETLKTGGQDLELEIQNSALYPLTFANVNAYHFELRFQPGVVTLQALQTVAQNIIKENSGWTVVAAQLSGKQNQDANALYLTNTQLGRAIAARSTKPGELDHSKLSIKIPQLTINPEQEGSIQILFAYRNIHTGTGPLLAGTAQHPFDVKHMTGYSYLPIHIGLAGSNTILTNNTPHTFEIHLINVDDEAITFGDDTTFILHFDISDPKQKQSWAISDGKMTGVKVSFNGTTLSSATKRQFSQVSWEFKGQLAPLTPGNPLILQIEDLSTDYPAGWTNLYVEYKNIPGYQDGQLILPLEKTPEVERGNNLGIGFDNPDASLAVNGGVHIGGPSNPGFGNLYVEGYTGVKKGLHVGDLTDPGIGNLHVEGYVGVNKGLHVGSLTDPGDNNLQVDGTVGIGFSTPLAKLAVNGGVHIGGTTDPGSSNLQVDGKVNVLGDLIIFSALSVFKDINAAQRIITTGNIGIGTNHPIKRLHIGPARNSDPASSGNLRLGTKGTGTLKSWDIQIPPTDDQRLDFFFSEYGSNVNQSGDPRGTFDRTLLSLNGKSGVVNIDGLLLLEKTNKSFTQIAELLSYPYESLDKAVIITGGQVDPYDRKDNVGCYFFWRGSMLSNDKYPIYGATISGIKVGEVAVKPLG